MRNFFEHACRHWRLAGFIGTCAFFPVALFAHEVYVLTPSEISWALATPGPHPFSIISANFSQFIFWAVIVAITIPTLFFMSLSRRLEKLLHPYLARGRQYAPLLVRIGVGASLVACSLGFALFGPELPLWTIYGSAAPVVAFLLSLSGAMILFRVYSRIAAVIGIILYLYALATYGLYLITYVEFLAAFVFFLIGGADKQLLDISNKAWRRFETTLAKLRPYRFAILRMGFGASVMFASIYAKIIYSSLALLVVNKFDLTSYAIFNSFSPDFLVLGAALVEFLCGALIFWGVEIRHTAAFLAFWLVLSLAYFQEMVWPHIILFGLGGAFLLYGYDWYSLEGRYFKRGDKEVAL